MSIDDLVWSLQLFICCVGSTSECSTASSDPSLMGFHQKSMQANGDYNPMRCE
jgi:hypothetical protein